MAGVAFQTVSDVNYHNTVGGEILTQIE
jgi:hypothetical protein